MIYIKVRTSGNDVIRLPVILDEETGVYNLVYEYMFDEIQITNKIP